MYVLIRVFVGLMTTVFQDIHTLILGKALTGIQAFVN